jgi:hypothetical protein
LTEFGESHFNRRGRFRAAVPPPGEQLPARYNCCHHSQERQARSANVHTQRPHPVDERKQTRQYQRGKARAQRPTNELEETHPSAGRLQVRNEDRKSAPWFGPFEDGRLGFLGSPLHWHHS